MAANTSVRTIRNGTIKVKDDAAHVAEAVFDGELTWRQTKNYVQILDRGTIDHFRPGADACVEVSFNILAQDVSDGTTATVYNALTKTGGAAAWTSTKLTSDVYHFDLELSITDNTGGTTEVITFVDCALQSIEYTEAEDGNKISFTVLSCAVAPTFA